MVDPAQPPTGGPQVPTAGSDRPLLRRFRLLEGRLVIELDGGQHMDREPYDAERTKALEACGYQVVRFWNNDVLRETEGVINAIRIALANAKGDEAD